MASSQCLEKPPVLDPVCGKGKVVDDIGGLKAYITGSEEAQLAIVLISDIFGYEAPNLRKLADKVAESGFFVIVPDFLHGDPFVPEITDRTEWRNKHGADKGFEDAKLVIEALNANGISTIGAAGFCWGGRVVLELAKYGYINAAVLLHPSRITVDDIKDVRCPISILGAEIDRTVPPELMKQFEKILSSRSEVESYVKIFPGVAHGWTVRYDVNDKVAVEKAEEAHRDMIYWFLTYVRESR